VVSSFFRSSVSTAIVLGVVMSALEADAQDPAPPAEGAAPTEPAAPAESPASQPPAPGPSDEALNKAKELFRAGVGLFDAGDMERALDYFLRSRAAFPSGKNTINAALCLDRLGRFDEALELYEEVLTRFGSELDDESRAAMAPAMASLRQKVGSIDVSANVEGSVVIDGHARGKLPLTGPLRVLPGRHVVRVLKDGYATAEAITDVQLGHTARVDVKLDPLAAAGSLRIEDPSGAGAEVFVDRVSVGTTPWEGTLGPGKHLVWIRKGDTGSAPTQAVVVQGQTVLLRLKSLPLGPAVSVTLLPVSAELWLDGVSLGTGNWEDRLPTGHHRIEARESGYFPSKREFDVPPAGARPVRVDLRLGIDSSHPRWPKPARAGELWIGLAGGYLFGSSLASAAESGCPGACTSGPNARGVQIGARAGYRFPFGLSAELGAGYLTIGSHVERHVDDHYGNLDENTVTFSLTDELRVNGPYASVGMSQRVRIAGSAFFVGRAEGGIVFAASRDVISGTARTTGASVDVVLSGGSSPTRSVAVFVSPELNLAWNFGALEVSAGMSGLLFVTAGPVLDNGQIGPVLNCPQGADPTSIGCVPLRNTVASERGFGRFFAFGPKLGASYAF
jgi:hypothetical protein